MSRAKYALLGLGCVLISALAVGFFFWMRDPAPVPTSVLPNVRVGYRAHDLYAPLFVGLEKQFFSQQGITVEPIKFESTNQITDALLAGKIDAALGGVNTPLLLTIEEKSPGEMKLFTLAEDSPEAPTITLIAKKDGITSVADLRGKKAGIYPGSTAKLIFRTMIGRFFDLAEVNIIEMKPELQIAALESGQVDAIMVVEPLGTTAVAKGIGKMIDQGLFAKYLTPTTTTAPRLPISASVISRRFQEQSEIVKRFVTATDIAIDYINSHVEETRQMTAKYTKLEPSIANLVPVVRYQKRSQLDVAKLQELADFLSTQNELKTKLNVQQMILGM